MESIVQCIELGAEDYLAKPCNPALLRARIGAALEKKRLRNLEKVSTRQIEEEQKQSERLLLNVLPGPIADRLKQGKSTSADSFAEATVLFADLVEFTSLSLSVPPKALSSCSTRFSPRSTNCRPARHREDQDHRRRLHGEPGRIQITEATARLIDKEFNLSPRGMVTVKGKGDLSTWRVEGAK